MVQYLVNVRLVGTVKFEDPHCPTQWMGSGIYDKEEAAECSAVVYVNAETEEDACSYAKDFDYRSEKYCPMEDVKTVKILKSSLDDVADGSVGVEDVYFGHPEPLSELYRPDPDARY